MPHTVEKKREKGDAHAPLHVVPFLFSFCVFLLSSAWLCLIVCGVRLDLLLG
jgi:hypothetical protein